MGLKFEYVFRNLDFIGQATLITVEVSLLSFVVAILIAHAVGVARSGKLPQPLRAALSAYVEAFRGTPLLVQLFLLYYGLPSLGVVLNAWTAAVLGLGLNSGAYMSEIVRSSILSVEKGQREAAATLGYTRSGALWHIVLPQSLRVSVPPLMNSFSSLLKESSLVSVLAITELTRAGNLIYSRSSRPFEIYLTLALLYLLMTLVVGAIARWIEKMNRRWTRS